MPIELMEASEERRLMKNRLYAFCKEENGQDLIEYSLLLAFLALATIGLLTNARTSLNGLWGTVSRSLNSANTAAAS